MNFCVFHDFSIEFMFVNDEYVFSNVQRGGVVLQSFKHAYIIVENQQKS